jgi:hypothetical protein
MGWKLAGVELVERAKVIRLRPGTTTWIVDDAESGEQTGRWRARIDTTCVGAGRSCSTRNRAGVAGRDILRQTLS